MVRRPGAGASVLVELKAVDDRYPLFGRLEARGGDGAPASLAPALARAGSAWGVLVDPALADRMDLAEGDPLSIGGIDFEVRGTIEHEPDRAGSGAPFGFWPRVLVSLDALAATELLREGSLVYHQYAVRLAPGVGLAEARAGLGERFRESGWQVRTYDDAAPGIQRMIERLGSFLSLVGLTALLVGGVGVSNAVRAWLDTRLGVIATLKCIGASRSVVFRMYLSQLAVIAGLGVLAGLAVGAVAPVAVSGLLETLLPVPIVLGIYPNVLALAVAFGLLTAVTFTVWPLSRAHETPAVALFRGVGLGVRSGRWTHLAVALAGGAALAGLAVATAPNRWFAVWFIAGAALVLLVFRAAGWAVVRGARAMQRSADPAPEPDPPPVTAPDGSTDAAASSHARGRRMPLRRLRPRPPASHGRVESSPARQRDGRYRAVARPRADGARRGRAGGRQSPARHRAVPSRGRARVLLRGGGGGPDRPPRRRRRGHRRHRPIPVSPVSARAHRAGERPRSGEGAGARPACMAHSGRPRPELRDRRTRRPGHRRRMVAPRTTRGHPCFRSTST